MSDSDIHPTNETGDITPGTRVCVHRPGRLSEFGGAGDWFLGTAVTEVNPLWPRSKDAIPNVLVHKDHITGPTPTRCPPRTCSGDLPENIGNIQVNAHGTEQPSTVWHHHDDH